MAIDSYQASYIPEQSHIQRFFEYSNKLAYSTDNEVDWYNQLIQYALNWLAEGNAT